MLAIYKKLDPPTTDKHAAKLTVPRYIAIAQKCVELKIPDVFIARSHFNDLYVLIMSIDIANLKQMIRQIRKSRSKQANQNVRDVSAADAVKYLKGGK
nr:MAG TPA: hypothetical protein [Caudoviricetes sp.]